MFKIKENTTSLQNLLTEVNNLPPTIQLQDKTISPSNIEQTISPDEGFEGFSSITVQTDENLKAENIIKNIEIFGITGSANAEAYNLIVSIDDGSTVVATKGNLSITGTSANGVCNLILPEPGTWTITATKDNDTDSTTIEINLNYEISLLSSLEITYSGTMTYEDDETTGYRYYEITDSGELSVDQATSVDIWICGGGGAGGNGSGSGIYDPCSGGGGGGGYFTQQLNYPINTNENIVISIGGAGSSSSFNDLTAAQGGNGLNGYKGENGKGGNGGSGGGGGGWHNNSGAFGGTGMGISTIPWEDTHFTNFPCAGGGGGGVELPGLPVGGNGGSNGSDGTKGDAGQRLGGATGGGRGTKGPVDGALAGSYYGAGGGGGASYDDAKSGASGYQGVCFLRVPLSLFN